MNPKEIIGGILGVAVGLILIVFLASKAWGWLDSTPPAKPPTVGASCSSGVFDPAGLCP
jgi:hypothetical protein